MATNIGIGIANAIGFKRQVIKDNRIPFYLLWNDGNKIAFDNNDIIIAK